MVDISSLAPALKTLLVQVDNMFPGRDKSSDGTIGDAAHAARTSDHNKDEDGKVRALDITHDPAHGLDARKLAEALVASRDNRIKYIISNAQIISSKVSPWVWRPYDGENAHRHHCHVSVLGPPQRDETQPWTFIGLAPVQPKPDPAGIYRFTNIVATEFGGPEDRMSGTETAYGTPGEWWNRPGVALPAAFPRDALPIVRVRNLKNGLTVDAPVIDKGPWYDGTPAKPADPYWRTGSRPRAETDPATNKAAIDLTPAAARVIGLEGKGEVDWDFVDRALPAPVPVPVPPPIVEPPMPPPDQVTGTLEALVFQAIADHIRSHPEVINDFLIILLNSLLKARGLLQPAGSPPVSSGTSTVPTQPAPAGTAPATTPPKNG